MVCCTIASLDSEYLAKAVVDSFTSTEEVHRIDVLSTKGCGSVGQYYFMQKFSLSDHGCQKTVI